MPAYDLDTLLSWRGRTVRDPSGDKIGKLGDLYLDADTDLPAYAGVRTGLFGGHESIVPLLDAREEDGDVVVAHEAEVVRAAPNLGPDAALTPGEEFALDRHYGLVDAGTAAPARRDAASGAPARSTDHGDAGAGMVRSEEELRVGVTPMAPTERVRLKKVLVTDHVEKTVPVSREVIQLETDAPPEGVVSSEDLGDAPPR